MTELEFRKRADEINNTYTGPAYGRLMDELRKEYEEKGHKKLHEGEEFDSIHYEVKLKNGVKVTMLLDGPSVYDFDLIIEALSKSDDVERISQYSQVNAKVTLGD